MSGFLDIKASDIVTAYLQKNQLEHESNIRALDNQANNQHNMLTSPMIESPQVAVDSGYASPSRSSMSSWMSGTWVLVGAGVLGLIGITLAVVK